MMDKYLKTVLTNTMKHEAVRTLRDDLNTTVEERINRLDVLINFQKIIDNYDELEPVLRDFFNKKAEREKWKEER